MEPADSIRRLGFVRWYERRLIEGHAWFVGGFLCAIVAMASIEELGVRGSGARLLLYTTIAAGAAAACIFGLHRYLKILVQALRLGEGARCGGCGAYARFVLVSQSEVRCRNCSHQWRLIPPGQFE